MLAYMRTWVQGLGNNQNSIIHRLGKQAVRNHENIRRSGEGGKPEAEGSYAYNQAIHVQNDIQGYVSSIPIVGQAQQFVGNFSGGPRRDMPGYPGEPGSGSSHGGRPYDNQGSPHSHPPSSGESASFYSQGPSNHAPGGSLGYAAPPGPPPSFPNAHDSYVPPHSDSYPPPGASYAPNYSSPPPSFPDYNPTGGYTPPPGGPGFPGPTPYGAPPGPPPGFSPPPGPPPGQGGYPGYNQQYGGRPW